MVPALVVMVTVPEYGVVAPGNSSVTNEEICCPAVTSIVRLPPAMGTPNGPWSVSVSVPADPAIIAMPVFVLPVAETGTETDRDVTVVALLAPWLNTGCEKRASTATLPLENTLANPSVNAALLKVAIVADPEGGIKNDMFGSTTAAGMRVLLFAKKSTIP